MITSEVIIESTVVKPTGFCRDCGKPIGKTAIRCRHHASQARQTFGRRRGEEWQKIVEIKPTIIETLVDIARYAGRAPGTIPRIQDISLAIPYIKDFETYLRLRLQIDIQSAQRKLWDIITTETEVHLKAQVAKSMLLLQQLELPKTKRDPLVQIEIDGHEVYFKRTRNWQ